MCSAVSKPLHGVLPVLQTPFTDSGEIGANTLQREIDWAFKTGADGVVVATLSEVLRLGYHGRKQLAEIVCQVVIEKYLLEKRGLFPNTNQIMPTAWQIDQETQDEVDRLFDRFRAVL